MKNKFKLITGLFTLMMAAMLITLIRVQPRAAWAVGIAAGILGAWKFMDIMYMWLTAPEVNRAVKRKKGLEDLDV
jgi:hypothetical protein